MTTRPTTTKAVTKPRRHAPVARKLVQIAAASHGTATDMHTRLFGLADDGTVWQLAGEEWLRSPPIPVWDE